MDNPATVFLVDDDDTILKALGRGLRLEGFPVRCWNSASSFLLEHDAAAPGCLVADISMPGLNGLELQSALLASGCERYIVFITGQGDIPMSVRAMKAGAVSFLPKPVKITTLIPAVREALEKDAAARQIRRTRADVESRLQALTARERQVLGLMLEGKMNKQMASVLGTAEKTIKVHRRRVMDKMRVRSVAELVLTAAQGGLVSSQG